MKAFYIAVFIFFNFLVSTGFSKNNLNQDTIYKHESKKEMINHTKAENQSSTLNLKDNFRNCNIDYNIHTPQKAQNSFLLDISKNGLTILLALIAGFITLFQMKANIISSARIRWIEDLRETLSKLYPATLNIVNSYECHLIAARNNEKTQSEKYYVDYTKNMTIFNALSNKVKMQLNSLEHNHKAIEDIIDVIDNKVHQNNIMKITGNEIENHLREIVVHSKMIFKTEWDRSKKIFKM